MTTKRDYTLGIALILIGIAVLTLNTNLISKDFILVAIGAAFLFGYYFKRNTGYLIAGLIILVVGSVDLIEDYLDASVDLSGFIFFVGLGLVFLLLYFIKKIKGFIYPASILICFGSFVLLDEVLQGDFGWGFFAAIGVAFYMIYLIETRKHNMKWPLIPGTILIVLSGLFYLTTQDIITENFWKISSYAWPVILILIGIRIILNSIRK